MQKTVMIAGAVTMVLALGVPVVIWTLSGEKEELRIEQVVDHGNGGLTGADTPVSLASTHTDQPFGVVPEAPFGDPVEGDGSGRVQDVFETPGEDVFARPTMTPAPEAADQTPGVVRPGVAPPIPQPENPLQELSQAVEDAADEGAELLDPVTGMVEAVEEGAADMVGSAVDTLEQVVDDVVSDEALRPQAPLLEMNGGPENTRVQVMPDPQAVEPVMEEMAEVMPVAPVDPQVLAFARVLPVVLSLNETYKPLISGANASGDTAMAGQFRSELAASIRDAVAAQPGLTFDGYMVLAQRLIDDPAFYEEVKSLMP